MKKRITHSRILAVLVAFIMVFGLLPIYAAEVDDSGYGDYGTYGIYGIIDDTLVVEDISETETEITAPEESGRDKLYTLIAAAQALEQVDFTATSWAILQLAILEAIIVFDNADASQAEIDRAITALSEAVDALETYEAYALTASAVNALVSAITTTEEARDAIDGHSFVVVQPWIDNAWQSAADTRNAALAQVQVLINELLESSDVTAAVNIQDFSVNNGVPNPQIGGAAATDRRFRVTLNGPGGTITNHPFFVNLEFLHGAATGVNVAMALTRPTPVVAVDSTTRFRADVLPTAIPQGVDWSVVGHTGATIDDNGLLHVDASVPVDTVLTVTATRTPTSGDATLLSAGMEVTVVASVVEWAGEGTAAQPFLIGTAEELLLLATRTNASPRPNNNPEASAMPFNGVHFRVTNDIDLHNLGSAGEWPMIGEANIRTTWINPNAPQGVSFNGIFDGGGHTITFVHGSQPLFGSVWANAEIRNVTIQGTYIAGHGLIAGVAVQMPFGFSGRYYILIDNFRILFGTTVRGSGISGTDGFRPQQFDIRNSTIEYGVRIGFDADANEPFDQNIGYFAHIAGAGPGVGSFVSGLAGYIRNSVSYATVYGHRDVVNVGGLVGYKQQSMRSFLIEDSHFHGTVYAPYSNHVGGILGASYDSPNPRNANAAWHGQLTGDMAANNAPGENIRNSTVTGTIIGYDFVGGIVGGSFSKQTWCGGLAGGNYFHTPNPTGNENPRRMNMPEHNVVNNHFEGILDARRDGTRNVGAIFGYIRSLNRNNNISGNTFAAGSAERGIGHVSIVDTIHDTPTQIDETTYFSTQGASPGFVDGYFDGVARVFGLGGMGAGAGRPNYYRTDDPLGEDLYSLAQPIGGTVIPPVDRSALIAAIAAAEARTQANYTPASWTPMQTALTAARAADNANATQTEVTTAANNLNSAITSLVPRAERGALNAAITAAQNRVQANYTPASWALMLNALTLAITERDNPDATQPQIDTATSSLTTAMGGLITVADRAGLNAAIATAEARIQTNYTPATWATMQTALSSAISVRNNLNATQAEINNAATTLNTAIIGLIAINRVQLNAAIEAAEGRTQANYTPATWTPLQTALAAARLIRDTLTATQAQVDTAASDLQAATAGLVRASQARVWVAVLNPNVRPGDPANFFPGAYIYIDEDETAYSILRRPELALNIRSTGHHVWAGMYVEAINNFGEFDGGPLSGWMYAVNRVFPAFSASLYELSDGDRLYWLYTYELGEDLVTWGTGSTFGVGRGPLNNEIARAEALTQANYTAASWAALQTALTAARRERDRGAAEQADIDEVLRNLTAAINALVRNVTANRTALTNEIARIEALVHTDYTAASWALMQSVLATTRQVYDNPNATQAQIDAALNSLRAAEDALVRIGAANLIALNNEISRTESLVQANYTAATWAAMQSALATARQTHGNTNATQEQVNTAMAELRAAINALERISGVNVGAINNEIARAEGRSQANYTAASWAALQSALAAATQTRNDPNATQAQINEAENNLRAATNSLVRLPAATVATAETVSVEADAQLQLAEAGTVIAGASPEVIHGLISQARYDRATDITLNVAASEGTSRIEMGLSVDSVMDIVADGLSLTIQSDVVTISIDSQTLAGITLGQDGNAAVSIIAETVENAAMLNPLQQVAVGNSTAISLSLMVGNYAISGLNGTVTVTIPYTPTVPAEYRDLLTVYFAYYDGGIREMTGARYHNSQITFMTNHFSVFFIAEWINPFADVNRNDWHFRNVRFAYSNNLLTGTAAGRFSPNTNLSRGMAVTMLWRLEGSPIETDGANFRDVNPNRWYANAIAWASANGIVSGYGNGMFGPNDYVTREQLAVIFRNYARFTGRDVYGGSFTQEFSDAGYISRWAIEAMEWANANGLITGRTMTTLVPRGTATRAEAASIIQRFLES